MNVLDRFKSFFASSPEFPHLLPVLPALQIELDQANLIVRFSHPYFKPFFDQHLRADFERACSLCLEQSLNFLYQSQSPAPQQHPLPAKAPMNPFDEFICSARNEPALECARRMFKSAEGGLDLVLFYGAPGSGKTHLLSLIAAAFSQLHGNRAACSSRAEAFDAPLPPEQFWKSPRALLLDDLQDISDKPAKQKLLCAFIDCARQSAATAKIALAISGRDCNIFGARLAQRLEQGMAIELFPADFSLRLAYAEKKARELELSLSRAQLLGIARHHRNISTISGVLQKFKFYASLADQLPAPEELEKLTSSPSKTPAWQQVLLKVSERLGIKTSELIGKSRRQDLVMARQAAMLICRLKFGLSYSELGRIFGGRDHATVMHGIKKVQELRKSNQFLHTLLTELEQDEG